MKKFMFFLAFCTMGFAFKAMAHDPDSIYNNTACSITVTVCSYTITGCSPISGSCRTYIVSAHSNVQIIDPPYNWAYTVCWTACPSVCTPEFGLPCFSAGPETLPGCGGCPNATATLTMPSGRILTVN